MRGQDCKQYHLENFGGLANDRKGLLRSNPGHRPAGLVDAEGAVTIDHDDAAQIWALLLDYKDLLMAKEVE